MRSGAKGLRIHDGNTQTYVVEDGPHVQPTAEEAGTDIRLYDEKRFIFSHRAKAITACVGVVLSIVVIWAVVDATSGHDAENGARAEGSAASGGPSFLAQTSETTTAKIDFKITKSTHFLSRDKTDNVYNFMMKYFNVYDTSNSCADNHCACGSQARVETTAEKRGQEFGLHAVYAAGRDDIRYHQSGNLTIEEIEDIFQEKYGNMDTWVPEFDSNTGLWIDNINDLAGPLRDDGIPFYPLLWTDYHSNENFISVFVNPPGSQIMYEVVAHRNTAPAWLNEEAVEIETPRYIFKEFPGENYDPDILFAVWVSRVTTDLERDVEYYKDVFLIDSEKDLKVFYSRDPLGHVVKIAQITVGPSGYRTGSGPDEESTSKGTGAGIRLVQPMGREDVGEYSIAWWENYMLDVHRTYTKSITCGWDIIGDNHYGAEFTREEKVNGLSILPYMVNQITEKWDLPVFCRNNRATRRRDAPEDESGEGDDWEKDVCYVTVPNGWMIQIDGYWDNPPILGTYYDDDLCATFSEYCDRPVH